MKTTMTLILCVSLLPACAGGDDDGDDATVGDSGSVGESTGSSSGDATDTMSTTMTTAPTTAETLSTTATTEDDSSGTDPTGDTTGGDGLGCAEYCGIYLSACADFSEYANEQDCMDNCAQWPVGAETDTANDSLGCRLYHVTVASSTDPEMHCTHAGPSGAATCVDADAPTCDLYCTRYFGACTEDLNAYADMTDCLDQCAQWYPGAETDVAGHTIACRSYHAGAAVAGPEEHCPHAGPGGGGVCVL